MRWPLRHQILIPTTLLLLGALVGNSALQAYFSVRNLRDQISRQMERVAAALSRGRFPLTDGVLLQAAEISGAQFQVVDGAGQVLASSQFQGPPPTAPVSRVADSGFSLNDKTRINSQSYFHRRVNLHPLVDSPEFAVLHVYFPVDGYRDALKKTLTPLVITSLATTSLVGLLATIGAARITRPLQRLRSHCERIAQGEFLSLETPRRNDEIRDLGVSINQMTAMLTKFEDQVRRNERLRALGQVQGGLAHQLRNAAAGCRMALDFHQRECRDAEGSETLDVAKRQLAHIDRYLRRFFTLDAAEPFAPKQIDLVDVARDVVDLVRPAAAHVGVDLAVDLPDSAVLVDGDAESLQQLLGNLVLNALEAAAPQALAADASRPAEVVVRVFAADSSSVLLEVSDSGPGPVAEVAESMFEPLVTGKPDGVGLGLSVARDIARRHAAEISWERKAERTRFFLELPTSRPEHAGVEPARR